MDIVRARRLLLPLALLALHGCDGEETGPPVFQLLSSDRTGVTFANTITLSDTLDVNRDHFLYNGAGVAVGDVNGDGLPDIFLTGNMVSSRLYLNRGEMRFEDVTEAAGVGTDRWATGASMVDIDGDGDLDIYVSVSGPEWAAPERRANLLFVNDGTGAFREAAAEYGIADTGYTTHAVFLDYDRDGHLDLYLLGNSPGEFGRGDTGGIGFGAAPANPAGFDQLYRNNGNGTFRNVSEEAGILRQLGYGLGVMTADLNRDGWPDLYVSNDVAPNDVLYINNRDGTFTNRTAEWLGYTSYAGMGIDIADFSNDGWPDIMQTDMMPEALADRQQVMGPATHSAVETMRRSGFSAQYPLNTLQLNQGVAEDGRVLFSEIGRLAGVAYTDWSWSALFGDYDNDGLKDLFVTNGYPKALTNLDYQEARGEALQIADDRQRERRLRELLDDAPTLSVANYIFRNEGDLTFTKKTREWGLDQPGYSYGAAYADLNNDGRLDLVVNNIDAPASIYENVAPRESTGNFLQVSLQGDTPNRRGLGAKLVLTAGGRKQYIDHTPFRGFMSTVDDRIHFGVGGAERVDSLEVIWPDGRHQLLTGIRANQRITVRQRDAGAGRVTDPSPGRGGKTLFRPMDEGGGLSHEHRSASRSDFSMQSLLPYQVSRQGPAVAAADVDGNGLDDVFIGGSARSPGRLLLQQADGRFVESKEGQPWEADREHEDWGALFFDATGDGLPDLYVASGGYDAVPGSRRLQDRLYLNRGQGRFVKAAGSLPEMLTSTAAVKAGDFNADGRLDLFVGGRLTPGDYPTPTRSYLLRNDGGRFTDVTREVAPELLEPGGMITDAVWMDFDGDRRLDLVTTGTWMPIQFYANRDGRLRDVTGSTGLPSMRGWWYSLEAGDLDNDGRPDLIAGNLGLNSTYTTSEKSRFGLYAGDFGTGGGTGYGFSLGRGSDLVFTQEIDGTEYPFSSAALLNNDLAGISVRFPTHEALARASVQKVLGRSLVRKARHYQADTFASVWLRNDGDGRFSSVELPRLAQISPIRGIVVHDVDGDRNLDLVVAGNTFDTEPNVPRANAGKGLWLRGDGRGGFTPVPPPASGFLAPFDVRDLVLIGTPGGKAVLVANHGGPLQAFTLGGGERRSRDLELARQK